MPIEDAESPSLTPDWPPPPHDPRERVMVALVDGWELRAFPPDDRKFQYFVTRGFWHMQLWHPQARVSVLTPSRLTGDQYEVFPCDGWKVPVREPAPLRALVTRVHGVALPTLGRLAAIVQWYVRAEEHRAARPHRALSTSPTPAAKSSPPARSARTARQT